MRRIALALPFVIFLAIYGVSIGHGFLSDDFGWILDSRVLQPRDLGELLFKSSGFYRPVVGLSFAADYALFGTRPLGYGLTNLAFAACCAWLLFLVARELSLAWGAALFASALWLLNPHGINTAILWMSGRTSLLLTIGSLGAVLLLLRGHPFLALLPAALALFAKEEAFLLPLILFAWWIGVHRAAPSRREIALWSACALALIGVYLALRFQTGAMTPWTAPPYYRFTFRPAAVGRNIWEYADRSLTFPIAVALLAWAVLRPAAPRSRLPGSILICGAAWIVGGYGLTIFLPVRSSLYACFPLAGACLIVAAFISRCWEASTDAARSRAVIAGVTVALAMTPVYVLRNRTTVANARFSTRVLQTIDHSTRDLPDGSTVVILDDRTHRPNVETAFNTALGAAFELTSGRRLSFWVEPELQALKASGVPPPCPSCAARRLDVRNGASE